MNAFVTLDYELYFGSRTGTPQRCLFDPVDALLRVVNRYGIKLTLYVDVAYIDVAGRLFGERESVREVKEHLAALSRQGHDLQLHLHPHWYYSAYAGGNWRINESKYKLSDLSRRDAIDVIERGCDVIATLSGGKPVSFRAGGWCIEGFSSLSDTFYGAGVRVDSTVYPGGRNTSLTQGYDFRAAPVLPSWRFERDPLVPAKDGRFFELPISAIPMSPLFYWKRVADKIARKPLESGFGDGVPTQMPLSQLWTTLTRGAVSVASIDGPKAVMLDRALDYQKHHLGDDSNFVTLSHPKALTRAGLSAFERFLSERRAVLEFLTVRDWWLKKVPFQSTTMS